MSRPRGCRRCRSLQAARGFGGPGARNHGARSARCPGFGVRGAQNDQPRNRRGLDVGVWSDGPASRLCCQRSRDQCRRRCLVCDGRPRGPAGESRGRSSAHDDVELCCSVESYCVTTTRRNGAGTARRHFCPRSDARRDPHLRRREISRRRRDPGSQRHLTLRSGSVRCLCVQGRPDLLDREPSPALGSTGEVDSRRDG